MERLHAEIDGPGQGPRIVLVHGFTQTRDCWGAIPADLAADHEVMRVDAPGHGRSEGASADLEQGARLLGATGGEAIYLGYSMGGRLALHLAVARPDLVLGLALIGTHPGIEDPEARRQRSRRDAELAHRLETLGLDRFLDEWLTQPLFAHLPPAAQHRRERLENTTSRLAASLRHAGTGQQQPLWAQVPGLKMPVLLVAGEHDAPYRAHNQRMASLWGGPAEAVTIPQAGHAAHLEQPRSFSCLLRRWLRQIEPEPPQGARR